MKPVSLTQRLAEYLKARPNTWIDGREFARFAGSYGWRTRLSECRRQLGLTIQNRQRHVKKDDGSLFTISEYRYVPPVPRDLDLSAVREQRLF